VRHLDDALAKIELREPVLHAWAHLDPERARAEWAARSNGPLTGVLFGAKDVFDTADMPTSYGSTIYRAHRPSADAAVVAQLRAAGAVCVGKTVTAEFAASHPGPTTNPHRPTHTPGGSSMGSAAAVSAGMIDLAIGTQTAGSVLRPASFCGIYGFKATYGSVSVAGVKLHAPSLDTVGWFAREAELLGRALRVLTRRSAVQPIPPRRLRVAVVHGENWACADPESRWAVEEAGRRLEDSGASVVEVDLPSSFVGLSTAQTVIQQYEAARSFSFEYERHRDELSVVLRQGIAEGLEVDPGRYDEARHQGALARASEGELFDGVDALLTPVAIGEAPASLATTGDPIFCRPFTLLGGPSISVPGLQGPTGLPIGVQLVAPAGDDARLIEIAAALGRLLAPDAEPSESLAATGEASP